MHDAISAMSRQLAALTGVVQRAEDHCTTKSIDPAVLLQFRLYPDMLPFWRQVTIACDHGKGAAYRLAGREVPFMPDTETSFGELRERIERTRALMEEVPAEAYQGAEERSVIMRTRMGEFTLTGRDYLWQFALPNLLFHATTAYNILRHNGVEIGKRDFLGVP
jgi:hypothetical protein